MTVQGRIVHVNVHSCGRKIGVTGIFLKTKSKFQSLGLKDCAKRKASSPNLEITNKPLKGSLNHPKNGKKQHLPGSQMSPKGKD